MYLIRLLWNQLYSSQSDDNYLCKSLHICRSMSLHKLEYNHHDTYPSMCIYTHFYSPLTALKHLQSM